MKFKSDVQLHIAKF